jgi:uncharacterized membrane protein (DUF106 family)
MNHSSNLLMIKIRSKILLDKLTLETLKSSQREAKQAISEASRSEKHVLTFTELAV